MKKWGNIVVYEFNFSFPLIFREWKMILSNLTLGMGTKLIFICNIQYVHSVFFRFFQYIIE